MMTVAEVQQRVWLRRAAVLGAGGMGRTIAAHLANTGIPTVMLDLGDLAHKAHQSLRQIDPAPLCLPDLDRLIEPGSLENDLARAAEADWIIEAIIEDLPTKQALLARLLPFWRPGTGVPTNTSGPPVSPPPPPPAPPSRRRWPRGAIVCWARVSSTARTPPTSSPTAWARTGFSARSSSCSSSGSAWRRSTN